jgi:hypothetical protein
MINFAVSLLGGIITRNIPFFAISYAVIGFVFVFLYKEIVRPNEYYFYYNQGISKIRLYSFCLIINVLFAILVLIIYDYICAMFF